MRGAVYRWFYQWAMENNRRIVHFGRENSRLMTRPINEVGQRRKIQMKKAVNAVRITSVLLLSALTLNTARADMITLKATGTVISVSGNALSPFQAPWSAVNPGDIWTVTYTFNSSTPNSSFDS